MDAGCDGEAIAKMHLYLQFGYGMMEHTRHLLKKWGGGGVILSPRDLAPEQLVAFASDIRELPNAKMFLDPQFFLPRADHERLCSHEYWPSDYDSGSFWSGAPLLDLLNRLARLNESVGSAAFFLPGLLASTVDEDWFLTQEAVLSRAQSLEVDLPLIMTIALSADAVRSQEGVALLLERSEHWKAAGCYLVCEHPGGAYLVQDPLWLASVIDIAAGLRLSGKQVLLGYCNHQMLIAAASKVNAICSGTWMNVRSFPPAKFRANYEEEIKQRAKWYYCPQALSEYRIQFLDFAQTQGLLPLMSPTAELDGGYCHQLFAGPQPTSVPFNEQPAFRHYLNALRGQAISAVRDSFDATIATHETLLNDAENLLGTLTAGAVTGGLRDFQDALDVNRAALSRLNSTRGPILRRAWSTL